MAPRGLVRVAAVIASAGLLVACAGEPPNPAPVILNGAGPGLTRDAMIGPPARPTWASAPRSAPGSAPGHEAQHITVRPGQSLRGIAHAHHVTEDAIVAANRLRPPYKLEVGQHLVIPGLGLPLRQIAAEPSVAPVAARHSQPDIIPLDGPAPASEPASENPAERPQHMASLTPPPAPAAERKPPAAPGATPGATPGAAAEARAEAPSAAPPPAAPAPRNGHFPWPVHGHVVAGYGVATGGAHNDGINIAAPRGAPVKAVDSGIVAYAGNELRGYGNLVLVKHPDGWISAYAHCEELLVKRGETVRRGQVIAKVGETGGVDSPQLHFELRRGKRPVDPKEFLAPAPSAGVPDGNKAG